MRMLCVVCNDSYDGDDVFAGMEHAKCERTLLMTDEKPANWEEFLSQAEKHAAEGVSVPVGIGVPVTVNVNNKRSTSGRSRDRYWVCDLNDAPYVAAKLTGGIEYVTIVDIRPSGDKALIVFRGDDEAAEAALANQFGQRLRTDRNIVEYEET
jgi:hypothetical protein